jgi:hypothetical protein
MVMAVILFGIYNGQLAYFIKVWGTDDLFDLGLEVLAEVVMRVLSSGM